MNNGKKKALQALKTCRGQVDGIIAMIEEGRYCIDISNQIMASQSMLKLANRLILGQHLDGCVHEALKDKKKATEKLEEIGGIIEKLLS